ncbi:hypothetical protein LguiB_021971 [Lonicera macranthoides]
MGVPSVEDNQISKSSSPKQLTSDIKDEFGYKDICCVSADLKNETSENVGKETAETTLLDSVSYSIDQIRLPARSVNREISSPQQTTSGLNHLIGSENINIEALQQKEVIPLENTSFEESGPPVDDASKNQGLGQLDARQKDAIHNTSKSGYGKREGEASATNYNPQELGPLPNDVLKGQGRAPLEPNYQVLEDAPADFRPKESGRTPNYASTSQLFEGSGPPPEYLSTNQGAGQIEPMQENAVTSSNPQACGEPPYYESKNRSFGQLEEMQEDATQQPTSQLGHEEKGEDAMTNSDQEESGAPPDDVSKNQGLERFEPMQEDAATNSNPEELGPPQDDVSKNQGLERFEPMQEDVATNSNPKESRSPWDDVSKNLDLKQLEPMQEDATKYTIRWEPGEKGEDAARNSSCKELEPSPKDVAKNQGLGNIEQMQEVANPNSCQSEHGENGVDISRNSSCKDLGPPLEDVSKNQGIVDKELMREVAKPNSSQLEDGENGEDITRNSSCKELGPALEDVLNNQGIGDIELMHEVASPNPSQLGHGENGEDNARNSNAEELGLPAGDMSKDNGLGQFEPLQEDATHNTSQPGHGRKVTSVKPREGQNKSRPPGSPRVLRSRSGEKSKAPEVSTNSAANFANKKKRRKKKKKKEMKNVTVNEFSRIRTHLKYLLTRMQYEQNFIDAYSGEGWKGQSLEKIKPEKELQRAKSEIFRCKLKIRDLFQRLHISCAEGRLPEHLFDSEGEIDSEDIFCAKCGSKELPANNDIILCDGACERGFHQLCLDPPLLNEDIPPDDEGWLCPGCDCKVDCTDLLNDSQGTNLSITDSWEEVFPEAAAAASGNNLADLSGLPSDDSEDDDYDPEGPQLDEEMQGEESSSDESDFSSASDDLGTLPINDPYAGLPSDDSEDDDYNPNSQNLDEKVQQESSSSDFTSDSEYFSAGSDDNRPDDEVQGPNGERLELGRKKRQTLSDELASLLDSGLEGGDSAPRSEKRHVERLDYKRLHNETYGNVSSDSSDEDYMDTTNEPKRRKTNNGKVAYVLHNRKTQNNDLKDIKHNEKESDGKVASVLHNRKTQINDLKDIKHNERESEQTPKRRTRSKKQDNEATSDSPAKSHQGSSGPDSCGKSTTRSANRRLGEAVTQRLLESFKESQFPERAVKEKLATELSLTVKQVSKWFENARWSFTHSSRMESKLAESASRNGTRDHANSGLEKSAAAQNSSPAKSRKSKGKSYKSKTEAVEEMTQKQNVDDNAPKAQEVRRSSRVQSKSTDSGL